MRSLAITTLIIAASALVLAVDPASAYAEPSPTLAKLARPKDPQAKQHFTAGNRFYRIREFEKATEEYKAAILLEDLPILHFNLAQAYRQLGKYEEAIWYYERFLGRVDPDPQMRAAIDGFLRDMKAELATRPKTPPPVEPAPPAVVPLLAAPSAPALVPAPQRDPPRRSRVLPLALVGIGVAALVTGGVLYAVDEDAGGFAPEQREFRNTAPLGIGVGIAGAVVAVTGGVLWWRSSASQPTVAVGSSGVTVGWSARF